MCLTKNGAVEIKLKKLFEAFLLIKTKIATQGLTWTLNSDLSYPNLSPLPLHYHTDPSKSRKKLSTYTSKLFFLCYINNR